MSFSVDDCEEAMKNANIDDNALVRMFHQCDDANELVDRAVECNDARALKLLIAEKFDLFFDVQFVSDRGNLLHLAFEFAGFRIVDMLLAAGLVEAESEFGAPPWHFAAGNSDESVMAHLIATGCDVNAVDAQQFSLAHRAAENTNEKVLAMLIAAGADVSVRDAKGSTPCHCAAANPNAAVMAQLLPLSDVNAADIEGQTPCMRAASNSNEQALALLIGAGANVRAVTNGGYSALYFALRNMNENVLELLVDANVDANTVVLYHSAYEVTRSNSHTPMHLAALRCNDRLVGKLIAAGGNVNATDFGRRTPGHMFRESRDPRGDGAARSMAMLIAANANVNAADEGGDTPLHCVAQVGFSDCVLLLVNAGANVQARNKLGRTPLHVVKNVDSAALLVGAKADLNAVDEYGHTACHRACSRAPLLSFLVGAGADVRVKSENGLTVLHLAAAELTEGFSDVLPRVIDAGADVNLGDYEGNCAGHVAAQAGCVDNLKLVLEHGAEIERRNNEGKTMLLLAARAKEHAGAMMRLLIDAGADTSVIDDTVAFGAAASALPLLRSLGVNLNCVNEKGSTLCHLATNSATLVALFALGATMTAKDRAGLTPYEKLCKSSNLSRDAVLTLVAAGLGFGVQTLLRSSDIVMAVVIAGGGFVSAKADAVDLLRHERSALSLIVERQTQLFRARALQVCVGLQSLRLSALEMCEILAPMFAPLESLVPFHLVWKVVTTVKHFNQ